MTLAAENMEPEGEVITVERTRAEPTDDELREIDRRARERMAAAQEAEQAPGGLGGALAVRDASSGRPALAARHPEGYVPRCAGGCDAEVSRRGVWCAECAKQSNVFAAELALGAAYASVSPEGGRDWCRPGDADFERAMVGTPAEPGIRRMYSKLPPDARPENADAVVMRASWSRAFGNLVLLGPTGIGKSVLMSAIALRILDRARAGKLERADFLVAAGIRYMSAAELAKASRRHKLGDGDPPLMRIAKRAKVLLLDEVGFGDGRDDELYEIMRARYEPQWKPTILASGRTVAELVERYGATARCFWPKGRSMVIDLHKA